MKHRKCLLYWLVGAIFIGTMPLPTWAQKTSPQTLRRPAQAQIPPPIIEYEEDTGNLTVISDLLRDYEVWRLSKPDKERYSLILSRKHAAYKSLAAAWLIYLGPENKLKPLKLLSEPEFLNDGTVLFPTVHGVFYFPVPSRSSPATFNGRPLLIPVVEFGTGIPLRKGELCPSGPDSCRHPSLKKDKP